MLSFTQERKSSSLAKEDGTRDMLGSWGRHTSQVNVRWITLLVILYLVPGLLPTSFVGSSLFSLCQCWRLCPWSRHLQVNFGTNSFEYVGNMQTLLLHRLMDAKRSELAELVQVKLDRFQVILNIT